MTLLSDAYAFLQVQTDEAAATDVFKQFDADRDNLITYVEYFNFIDKFICKSQSVLQAEAQRKPLPPVEIKPIVAPVPTGRTYRSRMRLFLWETLRRLYLTFDYNHDGLLQTVEAKALITDILKLNSKKDIDYILFTLFNLGERGTVTFVDFCNYFVEHVGELGLSLLVVKNPTMRRVINRDQFVQLFRSSFGFLAVSRIQDDLFWGFFNKIDTDRDGWISFEQYMAWLREFLCPELYRGDSYYFELDDADLAFGKSMILEESFDWGNVIVTREAAKILRILKLSKYRFTNLELAKRIRANIISLLATFDKNYNK